MRTGVCRFIGLRLIMNGLEQKDGQAFRGQYANQPSHNHSHPMNTTEASSILSECLAQYRSRPYSELAACAAEHRVEIPRIFGPSGTFYDVAVSFFWDDKPNGCVRVMAAVGKGIRSFFPLTESFILSPEGQFVGE